MTNEERVNKFRNEKIAVNCKTEEEAKSFIEWCYENGIEWGIPELDETHSTCFRYYRNETCYAFGFDGDIHLGYGSKHFHEEEGYEVITYKDFMKENKMTNLEAVASKGLIRNGNALCYAAHICKHGVDCREKEYGCSECEFNDVDLCIQTLLQEHKEPIKIKLTRFEFNLLKAKLESYEYRYFSAYKDLRFMKDNRYFKGITDTSMTLREILNNCEIVVDDYEWE